jgi:division protein CdvB (Snf7/Vps24/ESCRT-III family)
MSSSYNCEVELRRIAEDLHTQAYDLEKAAEVLETIRTTEGVADKIKSAKNWAKSWMQR